MDGIESMEAYDRDGLALAIGHLDEAIMLVRESAPEPDRGRVVVALEAAIQRIGKAREKVQRERATGDDDVPGGIRSGGAQYGSHTAAETRPAPGRRRKKKGRYL